MPNALPKYIEDLLPQPSPYAQPPAPAPAPVYSDPAPPPTPGNYGDTPYDAGGQGYTPPPVPQMGPPAPTGEWSLNGIQPQWQPTGQGSGTSWMPQEFDPGSMVNAPQQTGEYPVPSDNRPEWEHWGPLGPAAPQVGDRPFEGPLGPRPPANLREYGIATGQLTPDYSTVLPAAAEFAKMTAFGAGAGAASAGLQSASENLDLPHPLSDALTLAPYFLGGQGLLRSAITATGAGTGMYLGGEADVAGHNPTLGGFGPGALLGGAIGGFGASAAVEGASQLHPQAAATEALRIYRERQAGIRPATDAQGRPIERGGPREGVNIVDERGNIVQERPARATTIGERPSTVVPESEQRVTPRGLVEAPKPNAAPAVRILEPNELSPSMMAAEQVHGSIDPRFINVVSRNMYSGDPKQVTVKELVQNAVDAVRPNGKGQVDVHLDPATRSIVVSDNGVGMTPEVVRKEFIDLGGSAKPAGASGGFGIAKGAIFGNAEHVDVVTTVKNKDGSYSTTTLKGEGKEWLGATGKGLTVETTHSTQGTPGTRITIQMAEELYNGGQSLFNAHDKVKSWLQSQADFTDLPGIDINATVNGQGIQPRTPPGGKWDKLPAFKVPGGTMSMRASSGTIDRAWIPVQVLNNGYHQFQMNVALDRSLPVPSVLVMDVKSTKPIEHGDYPFRADREGLKDDVKAAVEEYIKSNIVANAAAAQGDLIRSVFTGERAVNIPGTVNRVIDVTGTYPREYLQEIANAPYLKPLLPKLNEYYAKFQAIVAAHWAVYGNVNPSKLEGWGLGDWRGLHVYNSMLQHPQDAVLINPFTIMNAAISRTHVDPAGNASLPEHLAGQLYSVLVHEALHSAVHNDEQEFSVALTDMIALIPETGKTAKNAILYALKGVDLNAWEDGSYTYDERRREHGAEGRNLVQRASSESPIAPSGGGAGNAPSNGQGGAGQPGAPAPSGGGGPGAEPTGTSVSPQLTARDVLPEYGDDVLALIGAAPERSADTIGAKSPSEYAIGEKQQVGHATIERVEEKLWVVADENDKVIDSTHQPDRASQTANTYNYQFPNRSKGRASIDEAMNAQGSALMSPEEALAEIDRIGFLKATDGTFIGREPDGTFSVDVPGAAGGWQKVTYPTLEEALAKHAVPGQAASGGDWQSIDEHVQDANYTYRTMDDSELQSAMEAKLRNIHDPNRFEERGMSHPNPNVIMGRSAGNLTPEQAAKLYNDLRKIETEMARRKAAAGIPLTPMEQLLADSLDNVTRNLRLDNGLYSGVNPMPLLRDVGRAINKLAALARITGPRGAPVLSRHAMQLGMRNLPDEAERGRTGIDQFLDLKTLTNQEPGKFWGADHSFQRQLAAGIPFIGNPSLDIPVQVHVANQARGGAFPYYTTLFNNNTQPLVKEAKAFWELDPPMYVGPADNPYRNELVDFMQNPDFYALARPELELLRQAIGVGQATNTNTGREEGNLDVGLYQASKPNAVYVSHVRSHLKPSELDEALRQEHANLSTTPSIAKTRVHDTLYERWLTQQRQSARGRSNDFEPELDLEVLDDFHNRSLAHGIAMNTFKEGVGGLTRVQVVDRLNPGMRRARDKLALQVSSLRGRIETADRQARQATNAAKQTNTQIGTLQKRAEPLIDDITRMGDEYGPELSHLSGQVHEMGVMLTRLTRRSTNMATRAAEKELESSRLGQAYLLAVDKLHEIRQGYANANLDNWRKSADVNRYFEGEAGVNTINAIARLGHLPSDAPVIGALLDAGDEIRMVQLGPDASPAFIQGGLGVLAHPELIHVAIGSLIRAAHMSDTELFGPDRIPAHERALYEATSGQFLAGNQALGQELHATGRGAERLPLIGKPIKGWNEYLGRALQLGRFQAWKQDMRIIKFFTPGMSDVEAAAVAWRMVNKLTPQIDSLNTGRASWRGGETMRARLERAPLISHAFRVIPWDFAHLYAGGVVRLPQTLGHAIPGVGGVIPDSATMTPAQKLALVRGTAFLASMSVIVGALALLFDDRPDMDPYEKLQEALLPTGSHFWSLHTPVGRIPLGGPFRTAILGTGRITKNVVEGDWASAERNSLGFARTGLMSVPSTIIDLIGNRDYQGRKIYDDFFSKETLEYVGEQVNLITGPFARAARTGEEGSTSDLALNVGSQLGGANLLPRSPAEEFHNAMVGTVIPTLQAQGAIPRNDTDGRPITSLNQLGSGEYDVATRALKAQFPQLDIERQKYFRGREMTFQLADDTRKGIDKRYSDVFSSLYFQLLNDKRMGSSEDQDIGTRDIIQRLSDARNVYRGEVKGLYSSDSYQEALQGMPSNSMRELEDQWFNLPKLVHGYVEDEPLSPKQWDEVEQFQLQYLQMLDQTSPGLKDRFQKNLAERDSLYDAPPILKLKREVDALSDPYYQLPEGGNLRQEYLKAHPELNAARWEMYGSPLQTIAAADAILHKSVQPGSNTASALHDTDLNNRNVNFEGLHRSLSKDVPMWDAFKQAIVNYQDAPSDKHTIILKNAPPLNAALVYFGASDKLHTVAAAHELDGIMSRMNWPFWNEGVFKSQVTEFLTLTNKQKDQVQVQFPNTDAAYSVFQNYLTGKPSPLHSEAARKEYARLMHLTDKERDQLPLQLNPAPRPPDDN